MCEDKKQTAREMEGKKAKKKNSVACEKFNCISARRLKLALRRTNAGAGQIFTANEDNIVRRLTQK